MRSSAMRLGEFLIFLGVFVLALQYIDWGAFAPIERADLVITGGVVLLICFVLALWSRSLLFDELIHVIALVVGAAVLGLIVSKSEVSTWVNVLGPERAEKTFSFDGAFDPTAATLTVTLDLHNGDATVQTWEQNSFQVVLKARARAWSLGEAQRLIESVTLQPQLSPTGISFRAPRQALGPFSSLETDVQLWLPRGRVYELNVSSLNGAISVQEINAATADLNTTNGRIKLNTLTAQNAQLQTANGSISGQLSASQATISTANGSIDLILGSVTGNYELSTFNGSIELDVPDDPSVGCAISAQSMTSRVRVQIPNFLFRDQERRRVAGQTNNLQTAPTKITITATTTNGSIEVR
ncbi:MAG: DUF4097 family beta strand repeat-containing protein [Candidatus Bipolaricaulota bacterium]|nr:DUF4097 family beta strand repeat-containing protein [Candidatus Bipolaricaulota bacterium]